MPAAILLVVIGLYVTNPPLLADARLKVFDRFQRLRPRAYQDVRVRIVDIDDESLARLGQWPWPRTQVAELTKKLQSLGASVIAFDIVFAEPDRTSPKAVLSALPDTGATEALRAQMGQLPDHDEALAQAFASSPVVAGFALTEGRPGRAPGLKAGVSYKGDDPKLIVPAFSGAVVNLELLEKATAGNGHFIPSYDRDGVVRRIPLLLVHQDMLYPALALEALRVARGATTYLVTTSEGSGQVSFGSHTGIVEVRVGKFTIPTDSKGQAALYYTAPAAQRTIPAWKILSGQLSFDALKGAIVFVGTSAIGLKDMRATPLSPVTSGVEIHAQLTEQILTGEHLLRPDWADGVELCYLFVLGLALILLLPRVGAVWCALLGIVSIAGIVGLSWWAFCVQRWLLDPVMPSIAVLLIYLVASFLGYLQAEMDRRRVRGAFSRYLSPVLVERLAKHPEQLKLGGERRTMTILFADIRGFTAIAEQFDAEGLTRLMNRFLTPMTERVLQHQGTIDKYIGDCIMAFWNAPLTDAEHARHACQAAIAMRDHLVVWNQQQRADAETSGAKSVPILIGIGINTGDCSVGNMGSEQRFEYSVLGDAVNVASRLEGQSKTYGTDIVIGELTRSQSSELAALELDVIRAKGKERPVKIFALLGDAAFARDPAFLQLQEKHKIFLAAYRAQRWQEALELTEACLALDTSETRLRTLYTLYRLRIKTYQMHPPGANWEGIWTATSK